MADATTRKLLVLDLDETLIHATETPLEHQADFCVGKYHVYRRPYLDSFIQRVGKHFDLGVWTSSGEVYARLVVAQIFPPEILRFVWASRRCTTSIDPYTGEYQSSKNLGKLKRCGFPLASILAVDDTPAKFARHYGNYIRVTEFIGDATDTELHWLAEYLPTLANVPNVRTVEKRGWRAAVDVLGAAPPPNALDRA